MIDLRLGRYQDVLADVESCDLCIFDAPYSEKTHGGHDAMIDAPDGADRRSIDYWFWTETEVNEAIDMWSPRTRGWLVTITDHVLAPIFTAALERHGRYVFAPIPLVETGSRVRIQGDGPSCWTCQVVVARPRGAPYSKWGTLRGAYVGPRESKPVIGGKPLWAMKALIEDYSRPGDLVVDICAGGGTSLLAARLLGRNAIGSEIDPDTHAKAVQRLSGVRPSVRGQGSIFDLMKGA